MATTTDHFEFTMDFDKDLTQEEMDNVQIYSGSYGLELNALDVQYEVTKNQITGSADNIDDKQAITVFMNLREGYWQGAMTRTNNVSLILSIIAFILLGISIVLLLLKRKSSHVVQTVEFYPPEGITSAEVGYIIDSSADAIDLFSLIIYWAKRGYLTIEQKENTNRKRKEEDKYMVLHKVKPLLPEADAYQKKFFDAIFDSSHPQTRELKNLPQSFGEKMSKASSALTKEFKGKKALHTYNHSALIVMSFGLVMANAAILFSGQSFVINNIFYIGSAFANFATFTYMLNSRNRGHFTSSSRKAVQIVVFALLFIISFLNNFFATVSDSNISLITGILLAVVSYVALGLCPMAIQDTDYYVEVSGKLLGLRDFIEKAEADRIAKLSEENPEYFYDVLPYAMVFGLADTWCKKFESIHIEQPAWYYGSVDYWTPYYFAHSMTRYASTPMQASVASYQAAQAAASSSSSGGFSGGGGGGGGGSSW